MDCIVLYWRLEKKGWMNGWCGRTGLASSLRCQVVNLLCGVVCSVCVRG